MAPPVRPRPLVFVVNTEPDFLTAIQQLLEDEGYAATVMPLVEKPYAEIVRLQPDLLIIDFPYREQLAWDLIEQLDATPATGMLPIIATSTDPDNLEQFAARPMIRPSAEVLLKPFDLEPLLELIGRLALVSP